MELTSSEKGHLKKILTNIFGSEAQSWEMTEGTLNETGKMLDAMKKCSRAMNYVPRPAGVVGPGYFKKQLRDIARRAENEDLYSVCKTFGASRWKSAIVAGSIK